MAHEWPLLLMLFFGLVVAFERLYTLSKAQINAKDFFAQIEYTLSKMAEKTRPDDRRLFDFVWSEVQTHPIIKRQVDDVRAALRRQNVEHRRRSTA